MKTRTYHSVILAAALTLLLNGCSDWLDVSPDTEKKKSEMFSKPTGFRNVLTGAYIRMKSTDLYGQELVCGLPEDLALHWNTTTNSQGYYLNRYDYQASVVENALTAIYNNLFKVVADVNGLLGSIDNGVLGEQDYNLIKGEALGLRAFCHFDVLRLFGPMPTDTVDQKPILPYVTEVSIRPNAFISYADYTQLLLQDLQQAEDCLKQADPILTTSIADLNTASKLADNYYGYRQTRMNYYAVCALKARVLLWIGDKEEAARYAQLVIDAKSADGNRTFRLGTLNDVSTGDRTLSAEHIFDLKVDNLATTLGTGTAYQKNRTNLENQLYASGTTDIRFVNMWDNVFDSYYYEYHNYFVKYVQTSSMPTLSQNVIPLIRLYEMYLIVMECGTLEEANVLYKVMSEARNTMTEKVNTETQRNTLLAKEYNREFYGEGQAFYAYKRMGTLRIYFSTTKGTPEVYVVPLPQQEAVYMN